MFEEDAAWLEHLRKTRRDFASYEERHRQLDLELNKLHKRRVLAPEEELHKRVLQKEKLAVKDRMSEIVRLSKSTESIR